MRKLDNAIVQKNYLQIKQDVQDIINAEMERVLGDPGLGHLVIRNKACIARKRIDAL